MKSIASSLLTLKSVINLKHISRWDQEFGWKLKDNQVFCHLQDNYPEYPAFWFTESDEPDISNLMDLISGLNNTKITSQIQRICKELCRLHLLPLPDEIQKLEIPELPDEEELLEPDSDSDDEVLDEDFDLDMAIQAYEKAAADKEAVIGVENLEALRHSLNKRYNNSEVWKSDWK